MSYSLIFFEKYEDNKMKNIFFLHKMFYQKFIQFFKKFWRLVLEPLRHMTGRKNQTKVAIDDKSKLELEKWFESKKHNTYPTNNEVTILALKTNLNAKKVKKWIENKRTRSHF